MNITRDLERAVAGIAKVPEKEIATDGKAAFEAFRLAFEKAKAEAERTETNLEDIMSVVTQRTEVLSFLIRVHGAKKMLQKRAIIILMLLVEMDVWREDLKDNRELMDLLPEELHELLEDDAAATSAVKDPVEQPAVAVPILVEPPEEPQPQKPQKQPKPQKPPEPEVDIRAAVEAAKEAYREKVRKRQAAAAKSAASTMAVDPAQALQAAHSMILALILRAGSTENAAALDEGSEAFEAFRKAVPPAAKIKINGNFIVSALRPKKPIVVFMLHLHEKKHQLRSRISNLMQSLMRFPDWAVEMKLAPGGDAISHDGKPRRSARINAGGTSVVSAVSSGTNTMSTAFSDGDQSDYSQIDDPEERTAALQEYTESMEEDDEGTSPPLAEIVLTHESAHDDDCKKWVCLRHFHFLIRVLPSGSVTPDWDLANLDPETAASLREQEERFISKTFVQFEELKALFDVEEEEEEEEEVEAQGNLESPSIATPLPELPEKIAPWISICGCQCGERRSPAMVQELQKFLDAVMLRFSPWKEYGWEEFFLTDLVERADPLIEQALRAHGGKFTLRA